MTDTTGGMRIDSVYTIGRPGYQALLQMEKYVAGGGIPAALLELMRIRVSQINGCSLCLDLHAHRAAAAGETNERLWAVAGWRDAPFYTDQERAAFALAEALTRLADNSEGIPDELWAEAAKHFTEDDLTRLLYAIGNINAFNRLNVATRVPAGHFRG